MVNCFAKLYVNERHGNLTVDIVCCQPMCYVADGTIWCVDSQYVILIVGMMCWHALWYVDRRNGVLTVHKSRYCRQYGMLTVGMQLVCWQSVWYNDSRYDVLTGNMVYWEAKWYVDSRYGVLTVDMVCLLTLGLMYWQRNGMLTVDMVC